MISRPLIILTTALVLSACATSDNFAPVVDISGYEAIIHLQSKPPINHHPPKVRAAEPHYALKDWVWPAHGKIVSVYSSKNKGIDIGGKLNDPIYATAPGKVVYAGNGLRGYGNLIILKHNSQYLSAYAYNRHLYVKEGDWVKQGQKLASMGNSPSAHPVVHFEIRKAGKPVNPMNLLNK